MAWEVEFTAEFGRWWESLSEDAKEAVRDIVALLREKGPLRARPYADTLQGAIFSNLKELRIQYRGRPYRVIFLFRS